MNNQITISKTENPHLIIFKIPEKILEGEWLYIPIENKRDIEMKENNLSEKIKNLCRKLLSIIEVFELSLETFQIKIIKIHSKEWKELLPGIILAFKEVFEGMTVSEMV